MADEHRGTLSDGDQAGRKKTFQPFGTETWADIEQPSATTQNPPEAGPTYSPKRFLVNEFDQEHEDNGTHDIAQQEQEGHDIHDTEDAQHTLSDIQKQYRALPDGVPDRIHIIGTGAIGKLVAHALRSLPDEPPKVTLLFHRAKLLSRWREGPGEITVNRNGVDIKASGFDAEMTHEVHRAHGVVVKEAHEVALEHDINHTAAAAIDAQYKDPTTPIHWKVPERREGFKHRASNEVINHLIVTTKTNTTINALIRIRHRIKPWTTICFLQNGMGMIDEVNKVIFEDPAERPKYIQGVVTHGANVPIEIARRDPFYVVHAGQGTIALSLLESEHPDRPLWSRWLLRTLTRAPELVAVVHTETELLQLQLEKLAVNCIINPITALIDNRNGALLGNFYFKRTTRLMLAEISTVIRALPELRGLPNVISRFSVQRLEELVFRTAERTAENISSMLADMRAARTTEIQYINGYIIRRGEELGIKCVVNYGIMHTVQGKVTMIKLERTAELATEENPDLNQGL